MTANTRTDGERFPSLAARSGIRATTTLYPTGSADRALVDLSEGRSSGAAVLHDD